MISSSKSSVSGCCFAFAEFFASFSLVLLNYKNVAYKKKRVVAVAECYLIITHVKNKESKKQPFNKKGRNILVPSLQYCQSGQDDRKNRTFSGR